MEATNLTQDENNLKTTGELFCSEFTREVHSELIFISGLNIFLSIAAFVGNTLILVALRKNSSLHPSSKMLFRNLAITDLCVGVIAEPIAVAHWLSAVYERWDICFYTRMANVISGYILCSVSLHTMTAIAVDRLLSLLLGIRYRQVVTSKRICITLTVTWVWSFAGTSSVLWNPLVARWWIYFIIPLCLVTPGICYAKIFITLRGHSQVQDLDHKSQRPKPNRVISLNIDRYRKAVYRVLWVQLALVVCYLPYIISEALTSKGRIHVSAYLARQFSITIAYLNSSLNPVLYCWKIREVRQAVKGLIRQIFCSST